jgi:transcriptional regulator NrdR family protein
LVKVKKRNGKIEEYLESKIVTSVERAGANDKEAAHVVKEISKKLAHKRVVTSDDLSNMVAASLSKVNKAAAGNYIKYRDIKIILVRWKETEHGYPY